MSSWVRWEPENITYPCPDCRAGEPSVEWAGRLATRIGDTYVDERRNDVCDHVIEWPSRFVSTRKDDPRGEWVDVDWDPTPTPPHRF